MAVGSATAAHPCTNASRMKWWRSQHEAKGRRPERELVVELSEPRSLKINARQELHGATLPYNRRYGRSANDALEIASRRGVHIVSRTSGRLRHRGGPRPQRLRDPDARLRN